MCLRAYWPRPCLNVDEHLTAPHNRSDLKAFNRVPSPSCLSEFLHVCRHFLRNNDGGCYKGGSNLRGRATSYLVREALGRALGLVQRMPVGHTSTCSIKDLEGLRRRILLCGVSRPERTEDGIDILPFDEFARESDSALLFSDE